MWVGKGRSAQKGGSMQEGCGELRLVGGGGSGEGGLAMLREEGGVVGDESVGGGESTTAER
jgi:hypothetical protein